MSVSIDQFKRDVAARAASLPTEGGDPHKMKAINWGNLVANLGKGANVADQVVQAVLPVVDSLPIGSYKAYVDLVAGLLHAAATGTIPAPTA